MVVTPDPELLAGIIFGSEGIVSDDRANYYGSLAQAVAGGMLFEEILAFRSENRAHRRLL